MNEHERHKAALERITKAGTAHTMRDIANEALYPSMRDQLKKAQIAFGKFAPGVILSAADVGTVRDFFDRLERDLPY